MTLRRNAMLAGLGLLLYIGVGVLQMVIGSGVSAGDTPSARLASMAVHGSRVQFSALLGLATSAFALLLGVTFRALTTSVDNDAAWFAAFCRAAEGMVGLVAVLLSLTLLSLSSGDLGVFDRANLDVAGAVLFKLRSLLPLTAAFCFSAGSLVFAVLLARGRLIPSWLAWTGVVASALLVLLLPVQLAGGLSGTVAQIMWMPMAVFEIVLGIRFIVRGVAVPAS